MFATDTGTAPRAMRSVDAAKLLRQRIADGTYNLRGIPGERKLAAELGVSYMSARKVVQKLVAERVLRRTTSGRLIVASAGKTTRKLRIATVLPAFASNTLFDLQYAVSLAVERRGGSIQPITYVHDSDPTLFEVLEGPFDGIFFRMPIDPSPLLRDRLSRERGRVVSMLLDFTSLGIPSYMPSPGRLVGKLLDHLKSLGHEQVDCFNAQPHDTTVWDRVHHWKAGLEHRGMRGVLHDHACRSFQNSSVVAHNVFGSVLDAGTGATAYFCITSEFARGAIRACCDRGLKVGRDLSICGFSEAEVAKLMVPSLTTTESADPAPFLEMGLEWIETGGANWRRPLRLEPDDLPLFVGESTGPV